jgi:MFS family permease
VLPAGIEAGRKVRLLLAMNARFRASVLAVGLGCAQLIAWGVLYYAITVLAEPMRTELDLSKNEVFGSFTGALVIAGALAPWSGRMLDRFGGRSVLVASALVGASSFFLLARASSFLELALGWAMAGVAMSMGLYDVCFAAIGQLERSSYRSVVTSVTLIAGFASTVSWPLSNYLLSTAGWRSVCDFYALGMLLCAVLYLVVLPRDAQPRPSPRHAELEPATSASLDTAARARARLLAYAFAGAALIGGSMSAHVVSILRALDLPQDRAIWIASSIGALQVFGRAADLVFTTRRSAIQLGLFTFAALAVAIALLAAAGPASPLIYGFALLYGIANGLVTIAKATIPIELFGFERIGALLGTFSAPSLVTRALAPLLFAAAMSAVGVAVALNAAVLVGGVSLAAFVLATRKARSPEPAGF